MAKPDSALQRKGRSKPALAILGTDQNASSLFISVHLAWFTVRRHRRKAFGSLDAGLSLRQLRGFKQTSI